MSSPPEVIAAGVVPLVGTSSRSSTPPRRSRLLHSPPLSASASASFVAAAASGSASAHQPTMKRTSTPPRHHHVTPDPPMLTVPPAATSANHSPSSMTRRLAQANNNPTNSASTSGADALPVEAVVTPPVTERQISGEKRNGDGTASRSSAAPSTSGEARSYEGDAGAGAGVHADARPYEEISITGKQCTVVTNDEIDRMLYDETTDSSDALLPSRISSLKISTNRLSILPPTISKLNELNELRIYSNSVDLMDVGDEGIAAMSIDEKGDQKEGEPAAPADGDTATASSQSSSQVLTQPTRMGRGSGLRELKNLHSLEFYHESSPPLSSNQLPSSLTSLKVRNYEISERSFFSVQLKNLQNLSLSHIRSLKHLPDSVSVLSKLQSLSITYTPLTSLPDTITLLPALTSVDVSHNSLFSFPEKFDRLTELKHLDLTHNPLIVFPRVFEVLQQRGCEVLHDHMQESGHPPQSSDRSGTHTPRGEDAEGDGYPLRRQSSMLIEEIRDMDLSAPAPSSSIASTATASAPPSAHKSKRKLAGSEANEADVEHDARTKHARSSTQQSAASMRKKVSPTLSQQEEEDDDADFNDTAEEPDELAVAASSAAAAPPRRMPMTKRKLPEAALALDQSSSLLKKHKLDPATAASYKYYHGELDYADRILTGFIDPGRKSTLFTSIEDISTLTIDDIYKIPVNHNEREIVLVDEQRDVRLKQICKQARLMLKQAVQPIAPAASASASGQPASSSQPPKQRTLEELQLQVKLLACLVSDSFGGRVVVHGHHAYDARHGLLTADQAMNGGVDVPAAASTAVALPPSFLSPLTSLYSLSHQEVAWWKQSTQSNVVLLCSIQHGLCRHRSILFKYLIDLLFHPNDVACKLVRGFREGGQGHAWNQVRIRGGAEFILDTLDSPHLFRPISQMVDPSSTYYPQWAVCSSTAFATPSGDTPPTLASFRDLHLARRGRLLGEGSYSQVFECFLPDDAATSHACALKVSPIAHLTTAQFAALLKEIRILPHLQHTNIVTFLGYLITNDQLRVYMELIRGMDLESVINSMRRDGRRFTLEDILTITLEVANGLHYLHRNSVLHRDLKAAQILVGHPELAPGGMPSAFSMPIVPDGAQSKDRTIIKAKRRFKPADEAPAATTPPAPAAAAAAAALAASANARPSRLLPRSPTTLSFFSDAAIKLCDFNIAIPILESHEDADAPPDAHLPPNEFCGTLRWCAPEVFRASLPPHQQQPQSPADSAATPSPDGAMSSTLANVQIPNGDGTLSQAAIRLSAGKMSDVWSFCNVLFELLTLRLPYENVPTEPELNAKLTRGERTDYIQWLDAQYWQASDDQAETEARAKQMWQAAVTAASDAADPALSSSATATAALFTTDASAYKIIVGLFLSGTAATPSERPSVDVICRTVTWVLEQRRVLAQSSDSAATATATTTTTKNADEQAPGAADDDAEEMDVPILKIGKKRRQSEARPAQNDECDAALTKKPAGTGSTTGPRFAQPVPVS